MGVKRAEQQLVIAATPQRCFDAITDYDTFPEWNSSVAAAEVLTRDDDDRGHEVRFEIDLKVRRIAYTLRYRYEPPHHVSWDYVGGDVSSIDGDYTFEDRGDGTTLATYSLAIDPGMLVPGPLRRLLTGAVMKGSIADLKRRVEA